MTDLLPHRDGQEDSITLQRGMAYIPTEQFGNWYSPAAVSRMIEEARSEERERCEKLYGVEECAKVDRLESQLDNITCIVAEAKTHLSEVKLSSVSVAVVSALLADLTHALKAEGNK